MNREETKPGQSAEEAREILNAIRRLKIARVRLLRELSLFVDELPPEERADMLETVFEVFDGSSMAESANSVSRLFMTLGEERPELASELFGDVETFFNETDFGKMRKALEVLLDYWATLACKSSDMVSGNPVVVANLAGMLPPIANSVVRVLAHSLEELGLDVPSEILASALFNALLALDTGEIGRAVTSASRVVNKTHEGNILLGRDEPRFKAVLGEFLQGVLETVDTDELSRAAVALGEDLETAAGSVADLLGRNPELLAVCVSTWVSLHNIAVRTASGVLDELGRLPNDALSRIGEEVLEGLDTGEAVRALNSMLALAGRFTEANPELLRRVAADALRTVDRERLAAVLREAYRQAGAAVREDARVQKSLAPEEVGRRLNDLLASFNRAGPGPVRDYASRMMAVVDTGELERALRVLAGSLTDAVLASADTAKAFVKPFASAILRIVKAVPRLLRKQ